MAPAGPNEPARRTLFSQPILRVLAQVHVSASLNNQSLDFLDSQLLLFMSRVFSTPYTTCQDIKERVLQLLPEEIGRWAVKSADEVLASSQEKLKKAAESKKTLSHIDALAFPIEFILSTNYFVNDKVEIEAGIFLMAVVEYLCADILKLAANYATNHQRRTIDLNDIKSTLFLDPVLQELFLRIRGEHALLWLRQNEEALQRDLTALLRVFGDALKPLKEHGLPDLFANIAQISDFHKTIAKLLAEAADVRGIAQLVETLVAQKNIFFDYFNEFAKVAKDLDDWRQSGPVRKLLEDRQLLRAAEHHLLRLMWKPMLNIGIFHAALFRMLELVPYDQELLAVAKQILPLLEKARDVGAPFGLFVEEADLDWRTPIWQFIDYSELQSKIEGWQGKNIADCDTVQSKDGILPAIFMLNGQKKYKKPKDRFFMLFDKFVVCCKPNDFLLGKRGHSYLLKDIILMNNLKILEHDDSEDMKNVIELVKDDEHSIMVSCNSEQEKREWLSALHATKTGSQLAYSLEKILLQEAIQGPELPPELRLTEQEYRFAVPDSPDTIIFEIGQSNDGIPFIKAATVIKLVERLTYDKYADTNYLIQFLLTYRSFMDSMELLNLLMERFNIPLPKKASAEQLEYFKANVRRPVQLRVFNVVKNWVDKHFGDFSQSKDLLKKFLEFLKDDMANTEGMDKAVQALTRTVRKRMEEQSQDYTPDVLLSPGSSESQPFVAPKPESIRTGVIDKISDISTLDTLEVARQLTLIEFELFRSIKSFECLNQRWAKKNKEVEAPNIIAMIERFNLVSNWVKTLVSFTEDFQARVDLVERFIKIAEKCMELNNFNGMMEIVSGLNSISVNRLKLTWSAVSKKSLAVYNDIMQLMSPEKSYSRFRQILHTRQPPCIPYFGVYLTDLTFIEDGNKDFVPGTDLINFSKRRRTAAVITEIQQYQQLPYALERLEEIQRFLREPRVEEDEDCYQKSLEVEPRSLFAGRESDGSLGSTSTMLSSMDKLPSMMRSKSMQEIEDDGVKREKRSGSTANPLPLPPFHRKLSHTTAKIAHNISNSKSVTSALTMLKSVSLSAAQFSEKVMSAASNATNSPPGTNPGSPGPTVPSKTVFFTEADVYSPGHSPSSSITDIKTEALPSSPNRPVPPPRPERLQKTRSTSGPPDVIVAEVTDANGVPTAALPESLLQSKDRAKSEPSPNGNSVVPPPPPFRDRSHIKP